ncbi:hypothetical protein AB0F43_07430 [Kribbella sp. NPDC023972]|uniref:hypothetical protein n=1 Tax=Kribbella sp. NPDC023972 TaxID=3154795 RepID=UPI0033F61209
MDERPVRLITAAQARVAGISRGMLRSRRYQRVLGSVYVASEIPLTLRVRAEAALSLVPNGVLSHHTALALWGASGPVDDRLHVSVRRDPKRAKPRVHGLTVHEVLNLDDQILDGLPVSRPERTFLDLAGGSDLTGLVIAGDSLVRRSPATPESLTALATSTAGMRGIRLARRAATLVRHGVDSPMETRLRLLIVLSGLPEPAVGHVVLDSDGGWLAKPDLSYPELKIAIEYDGHHHLKDARQWQRDIRRRENLERAGWRVRVITAADLLTAPATILARISTDLHARHLSHLAA